ncbi:6269_t:CDS:2 [Dentiscutata heterogama]|uniref:6269_t:CDS:1 n=1 Tax=Dentiscutata heterogama TaxID=1316150 RepID=A0ACA9K5D6_9GLOM|nr:6269_t:CDS:2 [Dentiscutata heterogama]
MNPGVNPGTTDFKSEKNKTLVVYVAKQKIFQITDLYPELVGLDCLSKFLI